MIKCVLKAFWTHTVFWQNPTKMSFLTWKKTAKCDFLKADLNVDLKSIDTQSVATQDFFFCTKLALLSVFFFFLNWNIHSVKNNCLSSVPRGQPQQGVLRLDWHRVRHCLCGLRGSAVRRSCNGDIMAHGTMDTHTATQVSPRSLGTRALIAEQIGSHRIRGRRYVWKYFWLILGCLSIMSRPGATRKKVVNHCYYESELPNTLLPKILSYSQSQQISRLHVSFR